MELELIRYCLAQGTFAGLFVWLLVSTMKTNKEREARLQDLLEKFSDKYDLILVEIRDVKERLPK